MPLFRPPSEGDHLIVQATLGCGYNQCSFCSMYKGKPYRARPLDEVFAHMEALAQAWRGRTDQVRRVFLADGDAFGLPSAHLLAIATRLRVLFPHLARLSAYATPLNILKKSDEELARLKAAGLGLLYVGIESGAAEVLRRVAKGITPDGLAEALTRARAAGIKLSATVILGLGGRAFSARHAAETAALVNRAPPHYLSTLQLFLQPEAEAGFLGRWDGDFTPLDDDGVLAEQRALLTALAPPAPVIFRSNHASNCLALAGTLPKDGPRLLAEIAAAQGGRGPLRPAWMRGL
ncbi:coproporphyrinogen III oxidase [mine drainage metagenome]|uniref:Coproporphyrinogen III oxidase n=1 Tax=mine drainage metagenome TaxID=410659 RepID=A0A1J5RMA8_9ZZZZ